MPCIPRAALCAALIVVFSPMIARALQSPWNDVGASARPDWVHRKRKGGCGCSRTAGIKNTFAQ